jgi:uncharacterized membrane protein YjfL (UPF0719 family)
LDPTLQLILVIVNLLIAIALTAVIIFSATVIIGRFTRGFSEWEQIRKGNVAVAIYMDGVIISVGMIISPGLRFFIDALSLDLTSSQATTIGGVLLVGSAELIITFIVAIIVQYLGLRIVTGLTKKEEDIDEWSELKKGNVAVGAVIGVTLAIFGFLILNVMPVIFAFFNSVPAH